MRAHRVTVLLGILLVLLPLAGGAVFTVTTDADWEEGMLDGVVAQNDTLQLDTPVETLGFETELSLSYWEIWYGDAFVPETGFTGTDAIAFNGSDELPTGNITQLNYSIPTGFTFQSGSHFSAWMRHNASDDDRFRTTYRLEGAGTVGAWVDEGQEEVVCATGQEQQVITTDARDTWYNVNVTLYPGDDMVYCVVRNDSGQVVDGVNLSATIDFDRVVLRAEGDAEPWAWFDEVRIPRYRAEGAYHSPAIGNDNIQDWSEIEVDASNITTSTDVSVVFRALDSSGTVVDAQVITLANGTQTVLLTVGNSIDANVTVNGSTSDPGQTWSVASYTVRSNNTTVAAPSLDKAAVDPETSEPDDPLTFTAELTDDDGDQNTVDLWHRNEDGDWTRINQTTVTPVAADTLVTFEHAFTRNDSGTNSFLFNTTDTNGFTSETDTKTFTITPPDDTGTDEGSGGSGSSDEDSTTGGGGGGVIGTDDGGQNESINETNATGDEEENTSDTGTTEPPTEGTDEDGDDADSGTNILVVLLVLVLGLGAMAWYYLYR